MRWHAFARSLPVPLLAAVTLGCAASSEEPGREQPGGPAADVRDPRFGVFVPNRVDAVLGERMVIEVELAGDFRPADVGRARLDDGRSLATDLVWLRRNPPDSAGPRPWLPQTGGVEAVRPGETGVGDGDGRWVLIADPPIDAVGQGVWLAGRRVSVNWLPDPREAAMRVPGEAWSSPLPAGIGRSAALQRHLDPIRSLPSRRWRARFVSGELSPRDQRPIVGADGAFRREGVQSAGSRGVPLADPALDAAAAFNEARWIIGLARLYEADAELNLAVRRRLASVVDFGDGAVAPVWSIDAASTAQLLDDLTDQTLATRERARRAQQWLDEQPTGVAWVLSDAGRSFAAGEPMTTIGLLNATWEPAFASVEAWASSAGELLEPLPPLSVRAEDVSSRPRGTNRAAVIASVGGNEFQLLASAADAVARPPGFRVESLLLDLTLGDLLGGRRAAARRDATSGLLYLDHLGNWVLYVECRTDGRAPADDDTLTVALGSVGSQMESDVIARADGVVALEHAGPGAGLVDPVDAEVARFDGGWSLRLVVPERFLEGGRALRFGLQRSSDRGVRSAWPRAMLPWQKSAPRGVVALSQWDG
ncbi:MAG: hypothetical protein AAGJ54_07690 [Planctomycetota bacterium]